MVEEQNEELRPRIEQLENERSNPKIYAAQQAANRNGLNFSSNLTNSEIAI